MKTAFAVAFATVFLAGAAQAQNMSTNQSNFAVIKSTLNSTITDVEKDVSLTSAAIANSLTIEGSSAGYINNVQRFFGDAVSELNGTITDVGGDVSVTSAAIANSSTI
jgi:outer membrane murein-binding lipoprotein Lpp